MIVLEVTLSPEIVTVAVLFAEEAFSLEAVTVIVPLLLPLVGDTFNQLASLLIVQEVLELIVKVASLLT